MKKIKQLKELCKQMAHNIRAQNRAWRDFQKSGQPWDVWYKMQIPGKIEKVSCDSSEYRHFHIAYCLLRGTAYERIEPKVNPGNEPNWDRIEIVRKLYTEPEVPSETAVCSGAV